MGINNWVVDRTGENAAELQGTGKSTGFENVKNIIADKVHNVAETLGEKAAEQDPQSGIAQYGKQASEWLDQSAEYVRQFDYGQADARSGAQPLDSRSLRPGYRGLFATQVRRPFFR
jgi:hypothetical protein